MVGLAIALTFLAGLALATVGWKLLGRAESRAARSGRRRHGFAAIGLGVVACIASGTAAVRAQFPQRAAIAAATDVAASGTTAESVPGLEDGIPEPYPAPDFAGIAAWLNSPPLTMAGLRGKVVLIDFWTYSCINCVRTLPYLKAWDRKYRRDGVVEIRADQPGLEAYAFTFGS